MEINENTKEKSSTSKRMWSMKGRNGQSAIGRLFEKFSFYYAAKWQSCFKSADELMSWMDAWAEELDNRCVTFDEAKAGLDRCIELYKDWPPTFPQFLEACRPSVDYELAFNEAGQQMHMRNKGQDTWSNPAIYWAAVAMGSDLMSMTYKHVEKRWQASLNKAINDVKNGLLDTVIPQRVKPAGHLPAPKREGNYSEVAKRELAKMQEILNTEPKWKRDLKAKGRTIDENIPGLKHASQLVSRKTEAA